jgi:hypothetical protein
LEEFFEIGECFGTAFGTAEAGGGFGGVVGFAAVEAFASGGCGGFAFVVAEGAVAVFVEAFEHFADTVDWAALRAAGASGFGWVGGWGDWLGGAVVGGEGREGEGGGGDGGEEDAGHGECGGWGGLTKDSDHLLEVVVTLSVENCRGGGGADRMLTPLALPEVGSGDGGHALGR